MLTGFVTKRVGTPGILMRRRIDGRHDRSVGSPSAAFQALELTLGW